MLQETKLEPEVFDKLASYHDEVAETKQNFKALVDTALGEDPERKLVIFLDDLDRCLPETVVKIIEAVKLLLCGDHGCRVCFIFGLDRHVVGEAIQHRYPGSTSYTGENYLEKIFDLALEVPKPTIHDIDAFVAQILEGNRSLDAAIGNTRQFISGVLHAPIFANPRVIRRFLNRLAIYNNSAAQPIRDTRFLTWLAGSERFRSFRLFFVNATDEERQMARAFLARRSRLSQNLDHLGSPPDTVVRALSVPGTTTFFQLLGADIDTNKFADIIRFDSELRKYGL